MEDARSILVVDGDPESRNRVCEALAAAGYRTRQAESGEEALVAVEERRPPLVLLDVRLPGISGYEVLRELRKRFGEELPVMLLSADRTEPFDRVAGLLLGADDYLAKPFAPDELTARVRRRLVGTAEPETERNRPALTEREEVVLGLLADGLDQREIATQLVISSKTVGSHIQHILAKLGVHSRAQAVAAAHRTGLYRPAST